MLLRRSCSPHIVRPRDTHGGHGLAKIETEADRAAFLAQHAAGELYVAPFIDYRSGDGLYRKYRIVFVGGEPYPFHLAISPHWMVHYYNAPMAEHAWMRDEEHAFLARMDEVFSGERASALREAAALLPLDYVGIDCAIDRDGKLLIFEADSAIIVHLLDDPALYPLQVRLRAAHHRGTRRARPSKARQVNGGSLDPADWDEFRALLHRAVDDAVDGLAAVRDGPAWRPMPRAAKDALAEPFPAQGEPLTETYRRYRELIEPYPTGNRHPRFLGWVHGAGNAAGTLADLLASALDANVGGREHAPVYVERAVVAAFARLFGFPPGASGILTTGTSMGNLLAVVAARDAALGPAARTGGIAGSPLVAYAAPGVHVSVGKALRIAGLGTEALRIVGSDSAATLDPAAARARIAADRAAGLRPFLVVATAGSVDAGVFDPLSALSELCAAEGLWLHVDGAFGAFALLSPAHAALVDGIAAADSLAFDAHKWLQAPYAAGCVLFRDEPAHRAAFADAPAYLARTERGTAAGAPWFADYGLELSREFRALKLWFTLRHYGLDRLGRVVVRCCELAAELGRRVAGEAELELLAPVTLNVVLFRYAPAGDRRGGARPAQRRRRDRDPGERRGRPEHVPRSAAGSLCAPASSTTGPGRKTSTSSWRRFAATVGGKLGLDSTETSALSLTPAGAAGTLWRPMAATTDTLIEEYRHGFHDPEELRLQVRQGPLAGDRRADLRDEERAGLDARVPAPGLRSVPGQADAVVGRHRGARPDRLRQHPLFRQGRRADGASRGTTSRTTSSGRSTGSASPRPSASSSAASRRSTSPRSSTTPSSRSSRKTASCSATWTPRCASTPRSCKKYLSTVIPIEDNKFAALNSAVWSGGSFVYVPQGVEVEDAAPGLLPDQHREHGPVRAHADHRRRRLEGALHRGLHRAAVLDRLAALGGGRADRDGRRLDPLHDDPELVPQHLQPRDEARAYAHKNATVEWVDGNIGSRLTMKYPAIYLMGEGARGEILSAAFAGEGQHQDAGAKVIHAAPNTTSVVTNKSVTAHGGKTTYRGLVEIHAGATGAKTRVRCDALIMDDSSSSDTKPTMKIDEQRSTVEHEASVSKIGEEQLFYAMSRGLTRSGRDGDDRQRLLRLLRQGAADGVRGRAEPPDQARDGRLRRLTPRAMRVRFVLALAACGVLTAAAAARSRLARQHICVAALPVEMVDKIDSKTARAGGTFRFKTAQDEQIDDGTTVAAGTPGYGLVRYASPAGRNGHDGSLALEPRYLVVAKPQGGYKRVDVTMNPTLPPEWTAKRC